MSPAVTRRHEVFERIRSERERIRGLGVRRLGLFGSFARDEATVESDVDLLVEFEPDAKSFRRFMAAALLLEELLGREVELVTPEGLSPYLRDEIARSVVDVGP
jgi:predicted nucleotidyltransferase